MRVTCNKLEMSIFPLNMIKKSLFWPIVTLLVLIVGLGGGVILVRNRFFAVRSNPSAVPHVVATIYPLAEFARQAGGDLVEVTTITPPGVEPHEYEPTPQDMVKLYSADLVLINGNGVDAWADKIIAPLRAKNIPVIRLNDEAGMEPLEGDPHFWLDPALAQRAVTRIATGLPIDVTQMVPLEAQKQAYLDQLEALDQSYREGLARCERREMVTTHNAFQYLAKRYQLTTWYILGLSPEEDPSPQTIANVADEAKRKGVDTIFFETLVSPKLAETIAKEINAKTAVLNPIEGVTTEEMASGKNYLSIMRDNLTQLRAALHCT